MFQAIGQFLATSWLALLLTAAAAYLLGSVNSAIIFTRLFSHKDIREEGSGNAGATNVLRSQGKLPALLTTGGDLCKSIVAVLVGGWIMQSLGGDPAYSREMYVMFGRYLAGLFCIIGHLYPLYFGFRGGKGVLTTLGMMLILDWKVALLCLLVFIIVVLIGRMVSLGSVCAAVTLPILTFVFRQFVYHQASPVVGFCTLMATVIAAILVAKHIPNIRRIVKGTESRLSFGKSSK